MVQTSPRHHRRCHRASRRRSWRSSPRPTLDADSQERIKMSKRYSLLREEAESHRSSESSYSLSSSSSSSSALSSTATTKDEWRTACVRRSSVLEAASALASLGDRGGGVGASSSPVRSPSVPAAAEAPPPPPAAMGDCHTTEGTSLHSPNTATTTTTTTTWSTRSFASPSSFGIDVPLTFPQKVSKGREILFDNCPVLNAISPLSLSFLFWYRNS